MLFLGDLACPEETQDEFINCINGMQVFKNEIIIVNFEANIVNKPEERRRLTLYNLLNITNSFSQAKKIIVSLANNHMYDYPKKITETKMILENQGIGVFGLYEAGGG